MNPQKHINENEHLEREEQAIGEPEHPYLSNCCTAPIVNDFCTDCKEHTISIKEDEQLTLEKRQAEADEELNDLNEDYARGIDEII